MAQRRAERAGRLSPITVVALLTLNLVPLAALLPGIVAWSGGTLHSYSLLPIVVLPTVALATHSPPTLYRVQLGIAAVLSAIAVVVDSHSLFVLLNDAIATIGTLILITMLIERSRRALHAHLDELRTAGVTDPLTGALNRRGGLARLPAVRRAADMARKPVGLAAIDLDHFKRINDEFGHATGDDVLRFVCDAARDVVGDSGAVVRSGGEELVLLTVGNPRPVVDALMARLAMTNREPRITISVGLVCAEPSALRGSDELWAAVGVADLALYRAKAAGRNCVVDGGDYFGSSAVEPSAAIDPADLVAWPETTGYDSSRDDAPPHVFEGFDPAGSPRRWPSIERAKRRQVDNGALRLYQLIVAWTMFVGMMTTIQQMLAGSMPAVQGWVLLPGGWLFGGALIVWMRHLRTSWALTPVFVVGSLFELSVVFSVGVESRPPTLMLSLLVGLLVVWNWPRWPTVGQVAVTITACIGAAMAPDRPLHTTVAIAAVTGVSLVLALLMVADQRRREEDAEEELRWWALTDPLTGLGNRRALDMAADLWTSGYVAMVDVDSFKALNDRYGHGRGDDVLRALAAVLRRVGLELDPGSRAFRIGGDEFVVAGSNAFPDDLVSRIDTALGGMPATVSIGVGEWRAAAPGGAGLWEALAVADRQMFGRKHTRRTR